MQFKQLFDDNRAVSPVIGVILMVAITVILAAVIGTFVLGLGDQVQQSQPTAQFGFDQGTTDIAVFNISAAGGAGAMDTYTAKTVTITHETGDTIDANNLKVSVGGSAAYTTLGDVDTGQNNEEVGPTFTGDVSAGSSITVVSASDSSDITTAGATADTDYVTADGSSLDLDTDNDDTTAEVSGVGLSEGDTVRVIYDNPDSDKSSTLAKKEVQ